MNFLIQKFITTANRLAREWSELRQRIAVLDQKVQDQERSIHEAHEAAKEARKTTPILSAELKVPDPIQIKTAPEDKEKGRKIYDSTVASLTLLFVGAYTVITILLLCQSKKANENAQRAFITSQQANVTIGRPDGTVADIVWPKGKTGKAGLVVYFQNSGHMPAKFNWGVRDGIIAVLPSFDHPNDGTKDIIFRAERVFDPMWRVKTKGGGFSWSGTITIAGNSSYHGVFWELPKERMQQLIDMDSKTGTERRPFTTGGTFEFCDGFGNRMCRNFYLSYQGEPYNGFALDSEDECPKWEMQGSRQPHGDISEHLSPCEPDQTREELQGTVPSLAKP